jgi:hypothetical protein
MTATAAAEAGRPLAATAAPDQRFALTLRRDGDDAQVVDRCFDAFEDYCVVTESVRSGIEVDVQVEPVASRVE